MAWRFCERKPTALWERGQGGGGSIATHVLRRILATTLTSAPGAGEQTQGESRAPHFPSPGCPALVGQSGGPTRVHEAADWSVHTPSPFSSFSFLFFSIRCCALEGDFISGTGQVRQRVQGEGEALQQDGGHQDDAQGGGKWSFVLRMCVVWEGAGRRAGSAGGKQEICQPSALVGV